MRKVRNCASQDRLSCMKIFAEGSKLQEKCKNCFEFSRILKAVDARLVLLQYYLRDGRYFSTCSWWPCVRD